MDTPQFEILKRVMGVVWIALGLYVIYDSFFGPYINSIAKIMDPNLAQNIFGWILLLVLTPVVAFSLIVFGYFALAGDFAKD